MTTTSTIARTALEVHADAITHGLTGQTLTDPIHTVHMRRTDMAAASTITSIGLEVYTCAVTFGLTGGTGRIRQFDKRYSCARPGQQGYQSARKSEDQIPSLAIWLRRQTCVIEIVWHARYLRRHPKGGWHTSYLRRRLDVRDATFTVYDRRRISWCTERRLVQGNWPHWHIGIRLTQHRWLRCSAGNLWT